MRVLRFNRILGYGPVLQLRLFSKWIVVLVLAHQLISRVSTAPEDMGRVFGVHLMPVVLVVLLAYFEAAYRRGPSLVRQLPLTAKEEVRSMMGLIWMAFLGVVLFLYAVIFLVGLSFGQAGVMLETLRSLPGAMAGSEGLVYFSLFFLTFHVLLVFGLFPLAFFRRKRDWWMYLLLSMLLLSAPHLYLVNQLPSKGPAHLVWAGDLFSAMHAMPHASWALLLYILFAALVAGGSLVFAWRLQKPKVIR